MSAEPDLGSAVAEGLLEVERGQGGAGVHLLRSVVDAVQECNLRCLYCHPGKVWEQRHLDVATVERVFAAADEFGLLEVVLSGGEVTMHPQVAEILDATHLLQRPTATLVTNATLLTPQVLDAMSRSNLRRICVSVDGVDNPTHGSARGKNLGKVMDGLRAIQQTGREITAISVAHQHNYRRLLELSYLLAETGLASQHHLCVPSYSGTAREHYDALKLSYEDVLALQAQIDGAHGELRSRGLFLTLNSFWPITGMRSPVVDANRTITLQQVVEQRKDTLIHIRPSGEFRLAAISWGRETVGRAAVGDVRQDPPSELFGRADDLIRQGLVRQLPREVEALHKFQIGQRANMAATNAIIDTEAEAWTLADLLPVAPLSALSLLDNPIDEKHLVAIGKRASRDPASLRVVEHASGVLLVFEKTRSHITLIHRHEWSVARDLLAAGLAGGSRGNG
jgi:MoaA/NifB/PqqE/SkfB family radical SAM enzyme